MAVLTTLDQLARAEAAGPRHARALNLVWSITGCTHMLHAQGLDCPALPPRAWAILERAGAGETVDETVLEDAIDAAEALNTQLSFAVLRRWPGGT